MIDFCIVLAPGDIIDGKYRVVRLVGEGGMGAVYEGRNVRLDRPIAIKVMLNRISLDEDAITRFEREAQAAARIGSRHIVDILDLGELENGDRYMIMEFLQGHSLATRLKKVEKMAAADVARIGVQLLDGLSRVHDAGIIHRDLKPANVFLSRDEDGKDFVKILDFGVCKIPKDGGIGGDDVTGVGDLLGTPSYMSPEQLEHGPGAVTERSDLYAVGVLLYRTVAGRLPYKAKDLGELLVALRQQKNPPLQEVLPDIDPDFAKIIDHAVEWDPAARFQTAREFGRALSEWSKKVSRVNDLLAEFLDMEQSSGRFDEPVPVLVPPEERETMPPPRGVPPVPAPEEPLMELIEVHDDEPLPELEEVHEVQADKSRDPRAELSHWPAPLSAPLPELALEPLPELDLPPLDRPTPVVQAPLDELAKAEAPLPIAPAPLPRVPGVALPGKRPVLRKKTTTAGTTEPKKPAAPPPVKIDVPKNEAKTVPPKKAASKPPPAPGEPKKAGLPPPPPGRPLPPPRAPGSLPAIKPPPPPRRTAPQSQPQPEEKSQARSTRRPPAQRDEASQARRTTRRVDPGEENDTPQPRADGTRRRSDPG